MHAYIRREASYTHIHIHIHTYIHTCIRREASYTHIHIHTYIHACIHTYAGRLLATTCLDGALDVYDSMLDYDLMGELPYVPVCVHACTYMQCVCMHAYVCMYVWQSVFLYVEKTITFFVWIDIRADIRPTNGAENWHVYVYTPEWYQHTHTILCAYVSITYVYMQIVYASA